MILVNCNAQIQRNIWGVSLGVSSKSDVLSVFKQKGLTYSYLENDKNKIYAENTYNSAPILFAGKKWDGVLFYFDLNGKLGYISFTKIFSNRSPNYSSDDTYNFFEEILNMLEAKYEQDQNVETDLEMYFGAQSYDAIDNKTRCNLSFDRTNFSREYVMISYSNLNSSFPQKKQVTHSDL